MRNEQPPDVNIHSGPGGQYRTENHPAYGMIGVSRATGGGHLYGSDFDHHSMMILRIHRSEVQRDLSRDWYRATENIVEVALSESQWARLLSSPNVGDGVPCTIRYVGYEEMPDLPPPAPKADLFQAELEDKLTDALAALAELRQRVQGGKGGKDSLRLIERAERQIRDNTGFVAKQFGEHMEEAVDKAKEEVHAYSAMVLSKLGTASMQHGDDTPALSQPHTNPHIRHPPQDRGRGD